MSNNQTGQSTQPIYYDDAMPARADPARHDNRFPGAAAQELGYILRAAERRSVRLKEEMAG